MRSNSPHLPPGRGARDWRASISISNLPSSARVGSHLSLGNLFSLTRFRLAVAWASAPSPVRHGPPSLGCVFFAPRSALFPSLSIFTVHVIPPSLLDTSFSRTRSHRPTVTPPPPHIALGSLLGQGTRKEWLSSVTRFHSGLGQRERNSPNARSAVKVILMSSQCRLHARLHPRPCSASVQIVGR